MPSAFVYEQLRPEQSLADCGVELILNTSRGVCCNLTEALSCLVFSHLNSKGRPHHEPSVSSSFLCCPQQVTQLTPFKLLCSQSRVFLVVHMLAIQILYRALLFQTMSMFSLNMTKVCQRLWLDVTYQSTFQWSYHPRNPRYLPQSLHFKSKYPDLASFLDPPLPTVSCNLPYHILVVTGKPWPSRSFFNVPVIPLSLFNLALISFRRSVSSVMRNLRYRNISSCSSSSPWNLIQQGNMVLGNQ